MAAVGALSISRYTQPRREHEGEAVVDVEEPPEAHHGELQSDQPEAAGE